MVGEGGTVPSLCNRGPPRPIRHTGLSLGEVPAPQACDRVAPSWGRLRTAGGRASRPPRAPPFFSGHLGWTDPAPRPSIPRSEAPARGLSQAQGLDGAEPLPSGPLQSGRARCNGGPEASGAQISSQSGSRRGLGGENPACAPSDLQNTAPALRGPQDLRGGSDSGVSQFGAGLTHISISMTEEELD